MPPHVHARECVYASSVHVRARVCYSLRYSGWIACVRHCENERRSLAVGVTVDRRTDEWVEAVRNMVHRTRCMPSHSCGYGKHVVPQLVGPIPMLSDHTQGQSDRRQNV
jgi:hypothetical protein